MKVTLCKAVPTLGTMPGVVNAKLPGKSTRPPAFFAEPPVKVETDSESPKVIAPAVGQVVTLEMALPTANSCSASVAAK